MQYKSLITMSCVSVVISIFGMLMSFATHLLISRHYGAEAYGDFNTTLAITLILATLLLLGYNFSMLRFLPYYLSKKQVALFRGFLIELRSHAALTCVAVFIAGIVIAIIALTQAKAGNPKLGTLHLFIYCIWLAPILAMLLVLIKYYRIIGRPLLAATAMRPLHFGLFFVLLLSYLYLHPEQQDIFMSVVIYGFSLSILGLGLLSGLGFLKNKPILQQTPDFAKKEWRKVSSQMLLANLVAMTHSAFQLIYLEIFYPHEAVVGYFAAIILISNLYWLVYNAIFTITGPLINRLESKDAKQMVYNVNFLFMILFSLGITALMIIFARPILSWFGTDFTSVTHWVYFVAIGSCVALPLYTSYSFLEYAGFQKQQLILSATVLVFILIGTPLLIEYEGPTGAVLSFIIAQLAIGFASFIRLRFHTGIKPLIFF